MTDHVARLYATALALVVFFLSWAAVAARPWGHTAEAKPDARAVQLERREEKLRQRQVRVQRRLDRRFEAYRVALAERQAQIAALEAAPALRPVAAAPSLSAPSVSTVPAAPVTRTRSS